MPSNRSLALIALLAVLGWLASTTLFVVNEYQRGVQQRLEHVVSDDLTPGLHFKWPIIDKVTLFDARQHTTLLDNQRINLASGQPVQLDVAITWQVIAPAVYAEARHHADEGLSAPLTTAIVPLLEKKLALQQSAEPIRLQDENASEAERNALDVVARKEWGVQITGFRLQRISLPDDRQQAVIQSMQARWQQQALRITAEGEQRVQQLKDDADREQTLALAAVHEEAEGLKGQVEAEVAALYDEAYQRNPAFFRFYQALARWRTGMTQGHGVLVLGPDDELSHWFKTGTRSQPR